MHVRQLPMRHGWYWLRDGFRLWQRNPALLMFLVFGYLLILVVTSSLPYVGQVLASLLMPALSLGVLNGCRAIEEGRKTGPDVLFSGFRHNTKNLLIIGACYLTGCLISLLATIPIDGGALVKMFSGGQPDPAIISTPAFNLAALVTALLSTPVIMAYWFAPMIAGWWNQPALKAQFFSFHACLRNWRPFLAFGASLLLFCLILPSLALGVTGLFSPALASLLSAPLVLFLVPIIFASLYINARDVLGLPGDAPPAA